MIQRIHNFLRFFFWFEYLHCRWRINYTWRGFYLANIDVMCVCVTWPRRRGKKGETVDDEQTVARFSMQLNLVILSITNWQVIVLRDMSSRDFCNPTIG